MSQHHLSITKRAREENTGLQQQGAGLSYHTPMPPSSSSGMGSISLLGGEAAAKSEGPRQAQVRVPVEE